MHLCAPRLSQPLTTLDLSLNNTSADGARYFGDAVKVNQVMQLQFDYMHSHALRPSQTLITLDIRRNDIDNDEA